MSACSKVIYYEKEEYGELTATKNMILREEKRREKKKFKKKKQNGRSKKDLADRQLG